MIWERGSVQPSRRRDRTPHRAAPHAAKRTTRSARRTAPRRMVRAPTAPAARTAPGAHHRTGEAHRAHHGRAPPHRSGVHRAEWAPLGGLHRTRWPDGVDSTRSRAPGGSGWRRGGGVDAIRSTAYGGPCTPLVHLATSDITTENGRRPGRRDLRPWAAPRPVRIRPRPPAARRRRHRGRRRGTGGPGRPPAHTRSGTPPRSTRRRCRRMWRWSRTNPHDRGLVAEESDTGCR